MPPGRLTSPVFLGPRGRPGPVHRGNLPVEGSSIPLAQVFYKGRHPRLVHEIRVWACGDVTGTLARGGCGSPGDARRVETRRPSASRQRRRLPGECPRHDEHIVGACPTAVHPSRGVRLMRRDPSPGWAMASTRASMTGLVWLGMRGAATVQRPQHLEVTALDPLLPPVVRRALDPEGATGFAHPTSPAWATSSGDSRIARPE